MINQVDLQVAQVINAGQVARHIVETGGYVYLCLARPDRPGAMLADKVWQIQRIDSDGNSVFAAAGATSPATKAFVHAASNPAGLTFHARV